MLEQRCYFVRVLHLVNLHPLVELLAAVIGEPVVARCSTRDRNENAEEPGRQIESYGVYAFAQKLQRSVLLAAFQHFVGFSERKITHHVEAVEFEPFGHVHWFSYGRYISILQHNWPTSIPENAEICSINKSIYFWTLDSRSPEAPCRWRTPDAPASIMYIPISCRVHAGERNIRIIPKDT